MQYSAIELCQSSRTERNYFDMEFNMAEFSLGSRVNPGMPSQCHSFSNSTSSMGDQ